MVSFSVTHHGTTFGDMDKHMGRIAVDCMKWIESLGYQRVGLEAWFDIVEVSAYNELLGSPRGHEKIAEEKTPTD